MTGESVRLVPVSESPLVTGQPPAGPEGTSGTHPLTGAATPGPVPASAVKPTTLVIGGEDEFVSDPELTDLSDIPRDGSRRGEDRSSAAPAPHRCPPSRGPQAAVVVLALVVVFLLGLSALAVLASPLFSVSTVQVSGNVYTTDEELAPIIAGPGTTPS